MPKVSLSLSFFLLLGAVAAVARGDTSKRPPNPLLGSWQYEADGSKFVGRLPYRSAVVTITAETAGTRTVEEVVTANGTKFRIEYLDPHDGTFVPVKGNPYYDSESTTWTGPRTATRKERRGGKDTGTTVMIVSTDGKSFTADANRIVPEGSLYQAFVVWRRASP